MSNTAPLSQVRDFAGETELSATSVPTIDWLDVRSEFVEPVPVFCAVISDHVEQDTGVCFRTWRGRELRGSWDSRLEIRSDGRCVRIAGNPSRWGQPDNLGGHATLASALRVFDRELIARGLPPVRSAARMARLDLCQNLAVGRGQERAFLSWAAGQQVRGKLGRLYPDGQTVDYRGKGRARKVYVKYYAKGPELKLHRQASDEQRAWRDRCVEWCETEGVVRHEVTLRGDWLARRGLATVREWCNGGDAEKVLKMYGVHLRPEAAADPFGDVQAKLRELGVTERKARHLETVVRAWSTGLDMRGRMSRSSFYKARAPLLRLGWDIANPYDVTRVRAVVPVIQVRAVGVPSWYGERSLLAA